MRVLRRLLLVFVLAAVAACGDSTGPQTPSTAGRWEGSEQGIGLNVVLSPAENGTFTGSGSISAGTQAFSVTVAGIHVHPNVSFTINISNFQDINFRGEFDGNNTIAGALNGSGFSNFTFTLRRQ